MQKRLPLFLIITEASQGLRSAQVVTACHVQHEVARVIHGSIACRTACDSRQGITVGGMSALIEVMTGKIALRHPHRHRVNQHTDARCIATLASPSTGISQLLHKGFQKLCNRKTHIHK